MKTSELIAALKKCSQKAEIIICYSEREGEMSQNIPTLYPTKILSLGLEQNILIVQSQEETKA